jgi:hypothetical protein
MTEWKHEDEDMDQGIVPCMGSLDAHGCCRRFRRLLGCGCKRRPWELPLHATAILIGLKFLRFFVPLQFRFSLSSSFRLQLSSPHFMTYLQVHNRA